VPMPEPRPKSRPQQSPNTQQPQRFRMQPRPVQRGNTRDRVSLHLR